MSTFSSLPPLDIEPLPSLFPFSPCGTSFKWVSTVTTFSFISVFILMISVDQNVQVTTLPTCYSPLNTQGSLNHHKNHFNTQITKIRHTNHHKHLSRTPSIHKCSSHRHTPINHKDKMSPSPPPITTNQVLAVCNIHQFTQVWVWMLAWTWQCTDIQMVLMSQCSALKCNGHHKIQVHLWMSCIRRYWVPVLTQTVLHIPLQRIFGHKQQQVPPQISIKLFR